MKNVLLKISGKQYTENEQDAEPIEFVTEGRFYEENGSCFLAYDETELSGMEGCETKVEITPTRVHMTRSGTLFPLDTMMNFEAGHRFHGLYQTDVGSIDMEILTNSIRNTLSPFVAPVAGETAASVFPACSEPVPVSGTDPLSGSVSIDYSISLKGLGGAHNILSIEVLEDKGEIPADGL